MEQLERTESGLIHRPRGFFDTRWDPELAMELSDLGDTMFPAEYSGIPTNEYALSVSASRAAMEFQTLDKYVTPVNPEIPYISNGMNELQKIAINAQRTSKRCTFVTRRMVGNTAYYITVNDNGGIDTYKYDKYVHGLEYTAEFEFTDPKEGDVFEIGHSFVIPQSWLPFDGEYLHTYTHNVPTALKTDGAITDDGSIISESYAKRHKYLTRQVLSITIDKDSVPVCLYTRNGKKRFLPAVGDKLHMNKIVTVLKRHTDNVKYMLSSIDRSTFLTGYDEMVVTSLDNPTVERITVIKRSDNAKDYVRDELDELAMDYIEENRELADTLFPLLDPKSSSQSFQAFSRAYAMSSDEVNVFMGKANASYTIQIELVAVNELNVGCKLTNLHSAKTMVCEVRPDNLMPLDKNGIRAQMIIEPSEVNRMNPAFTDERYISTVAFMLHKEMREHDNPIELWDKWIRFLKILGGQSYYEMVTVTDEEERKEVIDYIIKTNQVAVKRIDNYRQNGMIIKLLTESEFALDEGGWLNEETGEFEGTGYNGIQRVMLLNKTSTGFMGSGSPYTNGFTPVGLPHMRQHEMPFSAKPLRTGSETSSRMDSRIRNPLDVKRERLLSSSVNVTKKLAADLFDSGVKPNVLATHGESDDVVNQMKQLMGSVGCKLERVPTHDSRYMEKLLNEQADNETPSMADLIKEVKEESGDENN